MRKNESESARGWKKSKSLCYASGKPKAEVPLSCVKIWRVRVYQGPSRLLTSVVRTILYISIGILIYKHGKCTPTFLVFVWNRSNDV